MSVHTDRLEAEYRELLKFRSNVMSWDVIHGSPPEKYRFTYNLRSMVGLTNNMPQIHTGFVVEVTFPLEFPRIAPDVRAVGFPRPFHPNIYEDGRFCLDGSQSWIPGIGVPLHSMCQMVGEIIAFQTYNLRSPANYDGNLRNWLLNNANSLPIDATPIRLPDENLETDEKGLSIIPTREKVSNVTIVVEHTGKRIPIEEMELDVTAQELLHAFAGKINLPEGTKGVLTRRSNYKQLLPTQNFREIGLKDGEVLIADFERTAGGGIPIRSFRDIQLIESILNHSDLIDGLDGWSLFAVILYTDEDEKLASYIRKHSSQIHAMSGDSCIFFVIEEPSNEWKISVRKYLGALTGKYFETIWNRLGTDSFRPFNKTKAYEIANFFGVKPNQLPCVILFSDLKSQETFVVEINDFIDKSKDITDEYRDMFRMLFSHIQTTMNSGIDECLGRLSKELSKEKKVKQQTRTSTEKTLESIKLGTSFIEIIGTITKLFLP